MMMNVKSIFRRHLVQADLFVRPPRVRAKRPSSSHGRPLEADTIAPQPQPDRDRPGLNERTGDPDVPGGLHTATPLSNGTGHGLGQIVHLPLAGGRIGDGGGSRTATGSSNHLWQRLAQTAVVVCALDLARESLGGSVRSQTGDAQQQDGE
uniref:Uncharacterized protein n=1 Tax=Anopheles culicifacies TaxID=139723 RepID=A0A182M4X9_9DIPT